MGSHDFDILGGYSRGQMFYELKAEGIKCLGIPAYCDGEFVDILLMDLEDPTSWRCMHLRADWLGADAIGLPEVRLQYSPFAWLEAGGTGVCNIHSHDRGHFRALALSDRILCDDIDTAMECWEWAFGGDDDKLERIVCDDDQDNIDVYFKRQAFWRASAKVRENKCAA